MSSLIGWVHAQNEHWPSLYIEGFMQDRGISIASALELLVLLQAISRCHNVQESGWYWSHCPESSTILALSACLWDT